MLCYRRMLPSLYVRNRIRRPGIGFSVFAIWPCSLSSPGFNASKASGSIRLPQRRKRRRLSADHPWPAMLCYRRMLPSLYVRNRIRRPGIGFSVFAIWPCSLSSPGFNASKASGSIRLPQRRKKTPSLAGSARTIPGPLCFATGICSLRFSLLTNPNQGESEHVYSAGIGLQ